MFHHTFAPPGHHHGGRDRRRFHRDGLPGGHGHGHAHPGGRPHGGRHGRFFETGDLRLVILRLIAEHPRHGYELIKAIEERLAGAYTPSPGVVYPTLTLLEELGQIEVRATEGSRKLFGVTPDGERALAASAPEVDRLFARMDAAAGDRPDGAKLQAMRAMHNLRTALRLRFARGLTEEQLREAVSLIDEAAVKVERL